MIVLIEMLFYRSAVIKKDDGVCNTSFLDSFPFYVLAAVPKHTSIAPHQTEPA
ncbi:MAG: hypothetical protein AAF711_10655 [Planctomycetota bacterium]